MMIHVYDTF